MAYFIGIYSFTLKILKSIEAIGSVVKHIQVHMTCYVPLQQAYVREY